MLSFSQASWKFLSNLFLPASLIISFTQVSANFPIAKYNSFYLPSFSLNTESTEHHLIFFSLNSDELGYNDFPSLSDHSCDFPYWLICLFSLSLHLHSTYLSFLSSSLDNLSLLWGLHSFLLLRCHYDGNDTRSRLEQICKFNSQTDFSTSLALNFSFVNDD